jgi:hypothetical protein
MTRKSLKTLTFAFIAWIGSAVRAGFNMVGVARCANEPRRLPNGA